jgi:hypothetical protein
MYENEKVYAIDLGEDLEVTRDDSPPEEVSSDSRSRSSRRRLIIRRAPARSGGDGKKESRRLHFALLLPLVYLLGPFAVVLTPEGRRRKDWVITGTILGCGWIATAVWHARLLDWVVRDVARGPILLVLASLLVGGFSVWARAVLFAGGRNLPANHRLPLPFRRAWGVGFMGLVAPGAGLLAVGCHRRAAAVLWLSWIPLSAAVFLGGAPHLQELRGMAPDAAFERALMIAAALAAAGLVGWLVQALEGARLVPWEERRYGRPWGDLLGLTAVVGMLTLMMAVDLAPLARHLGREARALRAEGYRLVPLAMVRGAAVLDPARTDYRVTAMEILRDLGREEPAAELRHRLESDLGPYLEMVRREEEQRSAWRRRAEMEAAARAAVPMGWFGPDPFPVQERDPEDGSSGSR